MRPPKQAHIRRVICGILLLSLFLQSAILAAPANKRSRLQRQNARIQSQIREVRNGVRAARDRAYQRKIQLKVNERKLLKARHELQVATLTLARKKIELHRATVNLREAKREYEDSREQAGDRLVAVYRRGEPGYLEMLFSAENFGDILERVQLAQFMMDRDRETLDTLKARKAKLASYQTHVKEKAREVSSWQQQVAEKHNATALQRETTARKLTAERSQVAALEAELAALERDSAEITAMLRRMSSSSAGRRRRVAQYAGRMGGLPVNGRITSGFGYRYHPVLHYRRLHTGIDIAAPSGTPIYAYGGGEVIFAGWRGGYGNAVMIDHGRDRVTLYGHMSAISVSTGQVVAGRQLIGYVGSTGLSTGPHCHFELRINGSPVNPR